MVTHKLSNGTFNTFTSTFILTFYNSRNIFNCIKNIIYFHLKCDCYKTKDGAITSMLGILTLQMGVFGGIIAGLFAAYLTNHFYKTKLPTALGFYGGTRFVPIISVVIAIIMGFVMYLVWPAIQNGIFALGNIVMNSGYFGTFVFGCIERALIPFGLHHIFYLPFWQTGMGGQAIVDGVTYYGAQNRFQLTKGPD